MPDFEPIRLVGLNKDLTSKRGREKDLYDIYFTLSSHPPDEWAKLFERCWKSSMGSYYKRARIDQRYLVIENCPLEWTEKFEDKMDSCIEEANEGYNEIAEKKEKKEEERRRKKKEEERKLDELADKFDRDDEGP